jgi:pyridoxal 5'-phosphate synthase pdxS subunit
MIKSIVDAVTIPVMAKVRIGHFVEAQILQAIGVGPSGSCCCARRAR